MLCRGVSDALHAKRKENAVAIDMDYAAWRFWVDNAHRAGTIILAAIVFVTTRKKNIDKRFQKIESSIDLTVETAMINHNAEARDRCSDRLKRIESLEKDERAMELRLANLPTHKDIKELSQQLSENQNTMSRLNGRLDGINRAVDLINEFLINQKG